PRPAARKAMTTPTAHSTATRPRWRVALLGVYDGTAAALKTAVVHAGGQVAIEAPARLDSLSLVDDAMPDVLILQPAREGRGHPDLLPLAPTPPPPLPF